MLRMKDKIKIIFVDIDWTLLDHSNELHEYDYASIEALKEAQKKGVKVFLCTARNYDTVEQTGLFKMFTPDGMALANGGLVYNGDEVIKEIVFSKEKFEKVCEVALENNLNIEAGERRHLFLIKEADKNVEILYNVFIADIPPVEDYHNRHIITVMLVATPEHDEKVKAALPEGISYYRFCDYGVDIVEEEHNKGDAVRFVLDYLGIKKEEAMAFGDDDADIDMFKEVGYPVSMGNAKSHVKPHSIDVTSNVWESGVKKGLIKFNVI